MSGPERITLAMTGASGAQYGLRLRNGGFGGLHGKLAAALAE